MKRRPPDPTDYPEFLDEPDDDFRPPRSQVLLWAIAFLAVAIPAALVYGVYLAMSQP